MRSAANFKKKLTGSDIQFNVKLFFWEKQEVIRANGIDIQDKFFPMKTTSEFKYNEKEKPVITACAYFLGYILKNILKNKNFVWGFGEAKGLVTPKKIEIYTAGRKEPILSYPAEIGETIVSAKAFFDESEEENPADQVQKHIAIISQIILELKNKGTCKGFLYDEPQKPAEPKKANFKLPQERPAEVPTEEPVQENYQPTKRTAQTQEVNSVMNQYVQSLKSETAPEAPQEWLTFQEKVKEEIMKRKDKPERFEKASAWFKLFKKLTFKSLDRETNILTVFCPSLEIYEKIESPAGSITMRLVCISVLGETGKLEYSIVQEGGVK